MRGFLPFLDWLPQYRLSYFKNDFFAGLTVGVMLIPQGMAYAYIAGLPPVYGLYAALLPQVVYAFLGTSRQLAVGPVAMDSLLVAAGVSLYAVPQSTDYIALAILLAFLMGGMQLLFGLFRLGFLVNFLSRPVISGFTSAAAFIIGLNQLKYILGTEILRSNQIHLLLLDAFQKIKQTHIPTLLLGLAGIALIIGVKKINKRYKLTIPGALLVVIFGIALVYLFRLDALGVNIVKEIPSGLPEFQLPNWESPLLAEMIPIALTLSLIAFMEAISVAKAIQARHKDYQIVPNQELIALGTANLLGAFFQSYPTTGGFSRSAVSDQAGAKTGVAALVSAVLIGLTLLYLTPLFYFLPKAVLASIIMVAVYGLIDYKYPLFLWKTKKEDFAMLLITFLVTLSIGIKEGILLGVLLSLVLVIYQTTRPHYAELGEFPDSGEYRNINRYDEVVTRGDILIFRYDASLYFANLNHFRDTLDFLVKKKGDSLKFIIFNGESMNTIDASAIEMLDKLLDDLKARHIEICFTGLIGPLRDVFFKSGLSKKIGTQSFYLDIKEAVQAFDEKNNQWVIKSRQLAKQNNA